MFLICKEQLTAVDQTRLTEWTATRDLLGHLTAAEKEEIAALLAKVKGLQGSITATLGQFDADRLKLAGPQAAADAAQAAAEKQRALTDAPALAAEAFKDHSGRVRELEIACRDAAEAVDAMRAALNRGEVAPSSAG